MRETLAAVIALALFWSSSGRGEDSHDRLIIAASHQDLPDALGRSFGIDFVRSSVGRAVSVGAEAVNVADDRWSVVRGSVYRQLRGGVDLSGSAEAGPGSTNGESFTYEKLQAGATIPLTADWRLVARDTFVDVEPIHGHVLTIGANFRRHVTTTQFEIVQAVGGNIEQRSVGFRIDGRIRKSSTFGGALIGESNNRLLLNEPGLVFADTTMRQVYAGMTLALGKLDLTLIVDVASSGGARRQSLGAVIGIPLASR